MALAADGCTGIVEAGLRVKDVINGVLVVVEVGSIVLDVP
jgi:hypothetical protein